MVSYDGAPWISMNNFITVNAILPWNPMKNDGWIPFSFPWNEPIPNLLLSWRIRGILCSSSCCRPEGQPMSTPTDQAADVSCRTSSSLLVSRCQPHTYGWCGVTCWIYMNIPKACPKKGLVMLTENWSSRTNGQYLSMCVYIYICPNIGVSGV